MLNVEDSSLSSFGCQKSQPTCLGECFPRFSLFRQRYCKDRLLFILVLIYYWFPNTNCSRNFLNDLHC
ncbi:hypothetical protein IC582_024985 [Cucumis melo]